MDVSRSYSGTSENSEGLRLAILGFARIEASLNSGLTEAFGGGLPDDLRRTPFKARVSLAVALNLLPAEFKGPPVGLRTYATRSPTAASRI